MASILTKLRRWFLQPRLACLMTVTFCGMLFIMVIFKFNSASSPETSSSLKSFYDGQPHFNNVLDSNKKILKNDVGRHNLPEDFTYVYYNRSVPLVWIGGVPRSGTTLMRAMLDAHVDVRCGEETRVIPRLLAMHSGMKKSNLETARLKEAHIDDSVLQNALGAYILSIISQHGEMAPRLCNKDPFTLRSMTLLKNIFPFSKFIFMIRDGRATVHSIITRKVTIKGFDSHSYKGSLHDWNRAISAMNDECDKAGPNNCLKVHYEQLVLHPEAQMKRILEFLDLPWDDKVLHHEKTIGLKGGISLSKKELSTDQVNKPVNLGALVSWVDDFPADMKDKVSEVAPMLEKLGYDPLAYPPKYGMPDASVLKNTEEVSAAKYMKLYQ